jgi:phage-related protein (TIGR01555 family)
MGSVTRLSDVRARVSDGIANLWSRLGTGADRNTQSHYWVSPLSQQQIEAAYRSSWLTRKVHDLVPFEMTRAGRDWKAEKAQIQTLEAVERSLDLWAKLRKALTVARLHGGSALILGVRQGSPETPLVVERLTANTLRYVVVASRFQLFAPYGFETDPESDFFGAPSMWEMRGARGNTVKIHPSRVITFHGSPLPPAAITMSQLDTFWGDPLLISIKSAIDNAETSQAAIATLLHELKQDVISIPGLTEQIATQGAEELLAARIDAISRFKSMFSALLLDGGDDDGNGKEEWETRQISFAQHPELIRAFVGIVAGAADIPVTRLMGESPGGLQSTGKGEQDDFNRMVQAKQTAELGTPMARLDEILIRSALGTRPPEIYSEFAPLEEPDAKDSAEVEYKEAQTVEIYTRTNLVPVDAMAKATVNRLIESGRWPGLDQAIEDSTEEPGEAKQEASQLAREAANENTVATMQQRGAITQDMAAVLLHDAAPRSLYVSRPLLNWKDVDAHFKAQGFEATVGEQMHVTIVFSRQPLDWMKVGEAYGWGDNQDGQLTVAPGGARLVEPLGNKGAVVLLFNSSNLAWRNREILEAGARSDYPEYQPHVTITYKGEGIDLSKVEPYRGKLVFGPEVFAEVVDDWEKSITEA